MAYKKFAKMLIVFLVICCVTLTYMPTFAFTGETDRPLSEAAQAEQEQPEQITSDTETQKPPEEMQPETDETEQSELTTEMAEEVSGEAEEVPDDEGTPEAGEPDTAEVSFAPAKTDYLSYDPLYIQKYANSKYVDAEELDLTRFVQIASVARGVATYNKKRQGDFDAGLNNYIAGMSYQIPVYNIDDNSKYYVCVPDVNLFNDAFSTFDLDVVYNNEYGEVVSGYIYEKGILYLPKKLIDRPQNENAVPENAPLAIQLNYAIGSDMDFSKDIPVQVLNEAEPADMVLHVSNFFDSDQLYVDTGVKGRKASDVTVFLNGSLVPIEEGSFEYDRSTGAVYINECPGVISNINIAFKSRTTMQKAKDTVVGALLQEVFAGSKVNQTNMKFFRTEDGSKVYVDTAYDDIFVGWRGHYDGKWKYSGGTLTGDRYNKLYKATGYQNSVKYLYGGYDKEDYSGTEYQSDHEMVGVWAFSSYAVGKNVSNSGSDTLTKTTNVTHYDSIKGRNMTFTIYQWMDRYRSSLELSKKNYGRYKKSNGKWGQADNGIGGVNNFCFAMPKTVTGADRVFAPDQSRNKTVTFKSDEIKEAADGSTGVYYNYYLAAGCNHLDTGVTADEGNGEIYVTCLGKKKPTEDADGFVVLAFVIIGSSQNACGIYKFAIPTIPPKDDDPVFRSKKDDSIPHMTIPVGYTGELDYSIIQSEKKKNVTGGKEIFFDNLGGGKLSYVPDSWGYDTTYGGDYIKKVSWKAVKDDDDNLIGYNAVLQTNAVPDDAPKGNKGSYVRIVHNYKCTVNWDLEGWDPEDDPYVENNDIKWPSVSEFRIKKDATHGDQSKKFEFEVEIQAPDDWDPLNPGDEDNPNYPKCCAWFDCGKIAFTGGGEYYNGSTKQWTSTPPAIESDNDGKATFRIRLAHDQTARIYDIPLNSTYKVTELASDHTPSYAVTSVANPNPKVAYDPDIAKASDARTTPGALATAEEKLQSKDGFVTVTYRNFGTGYVSVLKRAASTPAGFTTIAPNNYSLSGAVYGMYTDQACSKQALSADTNQPVTFTTKNDGTTTPVQVRTGDYYVKELKASKGFKLDVNIRRDPKTNQNLAAGVVPVTVKAANTASDPAVVTSIEEPVEGALNLRLEKKSTSTKNKNLSLGGAEYTLKYYDLAPGTDPSGKTPVRTWTFRTKDVTENNIRKGVIDFGRDTPVSGTMFKDSSGRQLIPLGVITLEETKNPAGFVIDKTAYKGAVRQTGGTAMTVVNGSTDVFSITNDADKETITHYEPPHTTTVHKTDAKNGRELPGAKLQVINASGTAVDTWTSTDQAHVIEALADGRYTLREISAPYGYDIADDVQFEIKQDVRENTVTMQNDPVSVKTSAVSETTGKRIGSVKINETITDTVHMTGLIGGRKYKLSGRLIDKTTGQSAGITASKEFTATADTMDVTVPFTVNSSNFSGGKKLVVYETLQRISKVHNETVPVEIQRHEEINDADQTIVFPGISTTALDKSSQTQNLLAGPNAVITDAISYSGLIPNETYVIEGELYDKTAGKLLGVKASTDLKPTSENGKGIVDFSFDASGLDGHTLVVYETLKLGDKVLCGHKNPDDTAQSIYVPKLRTSASLQNYNHEVKDMITYENLLADRKYVVRGWLVDTDTGEKVPGSDGKVDLDAGSKTSGQIEMVLRTEKYDDMYGHRMTAFEELYVIDKIDGKDTEVLVGEHKDLKDKDQTVEILYDIKVRKNVTGNLGDLTKVFEYTVEFTDLAADKAYTIEGDDAKTFMSDASGKATVPLKLRDDQEAVLKQIPKSATYKVTETASDHIAQYDIASEDMADHGAKIVTKHASNGAEAAKMLATAKETVDLFDGTIVVLWENNRDLATVTAVQSYVGIWLASFATVIAAALVLILRHRRTTMMEDEK